MKRASILGLEVSVIWALALTTITPFCGQLFSCGCALAGGMSECNIWQDTGPQCPWCSYGMAGFYVPFAVILLAIAVGTAAGQQWGLGTWWSGLLGGLLSYLGAGLLVGLLTALYRGYPLFLWWRF